MLLVIPSIELRRGKCLQRVQSPNGYVYSDDPIESAKLWRKENAKSLYIADIDGAIEGKMVNVDSVRTIVETVDIPIMFGGGLRTFDEVKKAFDAGVYTAIIGTMFIHNPDEAKRVLDAYGQSKIVIAIDARDGMVEIRGRREHSHLTAVSVALNAKAMGFRRIMYTDIARHDSGTGPNFTSIESLARAIGMKITVAGGLSGLDDLLKLQDLEPLGVDSVVIGRALYENRFSCQGLWRMCEMADYPYTAKV
ncbi:MAG TPA: 1-(5-phosphoribosyl)-5-[(5-phosphoribosylamino)methylideneamino] imidazole-4-carboxamide isomerase [Bacteroidota bacterium]|nr:1-(5-phosphoribosyl)-5-[(5-phosphoribosylamino)methylideneamino] imidazole-4-carboxamide isomerase [Bacteroidota bacterium]